MSPDDRSAVLRERLDREHDLLNDRTNAFLVFHSILMAGLALSENVPVIIPLLVSALGMVASALWFYVGSRNVACEGYFHGTVLLHESTLPAEDRIITAFHNWRTRTRKRGFPSSSTVFGLVFPLVWLAGWFFVLVFTISDSGRASDQPVSASPTAPTEWSFRAFGTSWWSWPPQDLPTFWVTLIAAVVALSYVILTARMLRATGKGVENAWKANQSALLKEILEEYASLASDVQAVHDWWSSDPSSAIDKYEQGLRAPDHPNVATVMGDSRRRVSQYFLRLRALCEKSMLDPELVAATLGDEPVQVFLLYIDPLDEAVRRVAGKAHKLAEREYFRRYLSAHFPENADGDPWGFRGE